MISKIKKPVSILLVFMMIVSLFAVVPITASAAVGEVVAEQMETLDLTQHGNDAMLPVDFNGEHFSVKAVGNAYDITTDRVGWIFDGDCPNAYASISALSGETITKIVVHRSYYNNTLIVKANGNSVAYTQSGEDFTYDNINASEVRLSANPDYTDDYYCAVHFIDVYYTAPDPDQEAADAVTALINDIGEVEFTEDCKAKIDAARAAYDALTAEQQALVTNYTTLTDAETAYDALAPAVDAFETLNFTPYQEVEYQTMVPDYDNWNPEISDEPPMVHGTNTEKMAAAFSGEHYSVTPSQYSIEEWSEGQQVVKGIKSNWNGWGFDADKPYTVTITGLNGDTIKRLVVYRAGNYGATNDAAPELVIGGETISGTTTDNNVYTFDNLDASEVILKAKNEYPSRWLATYSKVDAYYSVAPADPDQEAADAVIALIDEIGTVEYTDACKAKIDAARNAYDALTTDQKALVTNYTTLTDAETAYEALMPAHTVELDFDADNAFIYWGDYTADSGYWYVSAESDDLYIYIEFYSNQAAGAHAWDDNNSNFGYIYDNDKHETVYFAGGTCTVTVDGDTVTVEGSFTGSDGNTYNVTITYVAPTYTITWNNWDDTELEKDTGVAEGATPTYDGETPVKAEDDDYTYTFSGWTDGENTYGLTDALPAVSGDVTYTATFDATPKSAPAAEAVETLDLTQHVANSRPQAFETDHFSVTVKNSGKSLVGSNNGWEFNGNTPTDYVTISAKNGETITKIVVHRVQYFNTLIAEADENTFSYTVDGDDLIYDNINASYITLKAEPDYEGDSTCRVPSIDVYYTASATDPDQEAADAVIAKINALPAEITLDDKEAVEEARAAYDALTTDQKALIDEDTMKKLTDAETALAAAEKAAADQAAANEVIALINDIGTVEYTDASKAKIDAARAAYDALTAEQQALVTNYTTLTDAETAYDALAPAPAAEASETLSFSNVNAMSVSGEHFTAECNGRSDVTYSGWGFDRDYPNDEYVTISSNDGTIITKLVLHDNDYGNMPVVSVNGNNLNYTLTENDYVREYTFENVNAAEVKICSDPSGTESYYFRLYSADVYYAAPAEPITYTVTWMNGDTELEKDENVAEGATPTYDGETPTKAEDDDYTYTFSGWTDGTNTYGLTDTLPAVTADITYTATFDATAKPAPATDPDQEAADAVIAKINALPTEVTVDNKDDIEAARAAFEALTADQKALIDADTLQKLTDAETALAAAEKAAADQTAADAVVDAFNALPTEVTVDDKDTIEAARAAYDALTDDQKALIDGDTYKKLTDAETALAAAEKAAADQAAADAVVDAFNALPTEVTVNDKDTIEAARAAYDALTDDQKALIDEDTYKKLTDAESAYDALPLLGDVDGDGEVTILDATAIQRYLVALENASFNETVADVDGDGEISILDATYIQRWLVKLDDGYPIGSKVNKA